MAAVGLVRKRHHDFTRQSSDVVAPPPLPTTHPPHQALPSCDLSLPSCDLSLPSCDLPPHQ